MSKVILYTSIYSTVISHLNFQVGQRVLEVNEHSLLGITHEEAVNIMRSAGSTIRLVVCEGYDYQLVSS